MGRDPQRHCLAPSKKILAETETGSAEEQPVRDKLIHVQPYVITSNRIDSLKPPTTILVRPDLDSSKPDRGIFLLCLTCLPFAMNQVSILITDDDEDDRLLLRQALEKQISKAVVYEAQDGQKAIEYLKQGVQESGFDLVLLDVNMPRVNGFDVLDEIRSSPTLKHTPTVMISTGTHPDQISLAYQKGVNSYIKKPDDWSGYDEIAKAIKTCFLNAIR